MGESGYTFIVANWRNDAQDIRAVREQVLLEAGGAWEFGEPATEERAFHVLAYDAAGRAVGVARMQENGCIDYVAVRRPWRGVTVGGALLAYLIHIAQVKRLASVWAFVPPAVRGFFQKSGFAPAGDGGQRLVRAVPPRGAWQVTRH
jgi:GNAT superfamily N-acetyltransferase